MDECKTMKSQIASCKEVNEFAPLKKSLATFKNVLLHSLDNAQNNGVRGFLRYYLHDLQPFDLMGRIKLPQIQVQSREKLFKFNFYTLKGVR